MEIDELMEILKPYKSGVVNRSYCAWDMQYENEYICAVRRAHSNKWADKSKSEMSKMWSIIYQPKKSFAELPKYKQLEKNFDMRISVVDKGQDKGLFAIRIYGMTQIPDEAIVKIILDFIFE